MFRVTTSFSEGKKKTQEMKMAASTSKKILEEQLCYLKWTTSELATALARSMHSVSIPLEKTNTPRHLAILDDEPKMAFMI
jgi:hypothetical protein